MPDVPMPEAREPLGLPGEPGGSAATQEPIVFFEAAIVISLAVSVLSLFLFAWLGNEMRQGDTLRFDESVRNWVHQFASPGMTRVMTAISLLGYNILIVELLIAFIVFAKLRWKRAALWLAIAMIGSLLLDLALKYAYHRARPAAFFGAAPASYSFPSGHALCSLCFYGVLAGLLSARIKSLPWRIVVWTVAAMLIISIGLSRIYLGVHYPSDVLAGYLAATVWVGTIIVLDHVRKVRRSSRR
jgi:undecaprenyl-diphosphatase